MGKVVVVPSTSIVDAPDCDISVLLLGNSPQLQLKHGRVTLVRRGLVQNLHETADTGTAEQKDFTL